MGVLVYINRSFVALVFSIFFGNGATLADVEEDYAMAKQSFDSGDYKTALAYHLKEVLLFFTTPMPFLYAYPSIT